MSKYYLLTFNEDFGNEHNVPALECMTEEEYNVWYNTLAGILNENYPEEKEKWDERQAKYQKYLKEAQEKNLWTRAPKDCTDEERDWMRRNSVPYISSSEFPNKLKSSFMRASLGNNSDYFDTNYMEYVTMGEMVEDKIVKVQEVDENFYNTFKKTGLNDLSLCNVFKTEELTKNY